MWIKIKENQLVNTDNIINICFNYEDKEILFLGEDCGYGTLEYPTIDEYNTAKTKLQKILNIEVI